MTFYVDDESSVLPNLPTLGFILDESPTCQQSVKFWEDQTEEIGNVVSHVSSCAKAYYNAGMDLSVASSNFTTGLQKAANVLSKDTNLSQPLLKFTDMLQRVDCYYDMFLAQTEMLMCTPLENLTKEYEKVKDMKNQVKKANNDMHMSWEKFSSCQNMSNLQEPSSLDKLAHNMLSSRHHYQQLLATYINSLREVNTVKKVNFVKTLVENILARFFFVNFTYQILKDSENYTNELFDDILNRVCHSEIACENDARLKEVIQLKINRLFEKDKTAFNAPPTILGSSTLAHSVTTVNTQAGKFFNRINDLLGTSASRESTRRSQKGSRPLSPSDKQPPNVEQWEVLEEGGEKHQTLSKEGSTTTEEKNENVAEKTVETSEGKLVDETARKERPDDKALDSTGEEVKGNSDDGDENKERDVKTKSDIDKDAKDDESSWSDFKSAETTDTEQDSSKTPVDLSDQENDETFEAEMLEIPNVSKWSKAHRGYLRIKQKGFPRTKWPLLYFIVDETTGRLLAQGKDQREPVEFANLLLSSVKICEALEVDRNFCFQLTSPKSEHVLQALNENEMNQWIAAIQSATTEALKKSKEKLLSLSTTYTYGTNIKTDQPKQFVSNAPERVRKVEGNNRCVDCDHPRPDWASINLGVVMCIECSGVHRGLGVHISKVRSLTLDKWQEKVVQFMEAHGNTKMNKTYEGNLQDYRKPSRDSTKDERSRFIRLKYVDKKFMSDDDVDEEVDAEGELASLEKDESDEEKLLEECGEEGSKCGNLLSKDAENFANAQLQVEDGV